MMNIEKYIGNNVKKMYIVKIRDTIKEEETKWYKTSYEIECHFQDWIWM